MRRILYVWVCDVVNILTSLTFLRKLELSAVNIVVLSDGAQYYKHHAEYQN
ncbi:MAG: hypothetical protein QW803_03305 [Candidatus Methanomethylicia archaeon]